MCGVCEGRAGGGGGGGVHSNPKWCLFVCVCVEVLLPSQPDGVMLSVVSLPNHTFTGQA